MEAAPGMVVRVPGLIVFAIDHHSVYGEGKTSTGKLVYKAKPYSDFEGGSRKDAEELGRQLAAITSHFRKEIRSRSVKELRMVDAVCAVPFLGNRELSLPHVLAAHVAEALQVDDLSSQVTKTKDTNPSKYAVGFEVDETQFDAEPAIQSRRIALVDDVVRSGGTLASLAKALLRDGAHSAGVGLCATKARQLKGVDEY